MIELRFHVPDPRRRLAAVRLAHQLRERLPHELTRNGRAWELRAPAPDVARFEYQFELIDRERRERVDPRPGEPEARVGAVGVQVGVGGARLRAARLGRGGSGRQAGVGHDPEPHPEDRAAGADLGASRRDRAQSAARRARRAGVRRALVAADVSRPAASAPRRPDRAGRPERDLLRVGALLAGARRGDPARAPARSRPDRARRQPRRARRSSTRTAATRTASTPSSSSRAASSGAPRATSGTSRATSGSCASSAASTATGPSGRSRSCSRAARSSRTWPANRALEESLRDRGYDARLFEYPRRSQLGRVARLLPPPTAPPAPEDLT